MKLAPVTALQSLNENKIIEKGRSRKSKFSYNEIIPNMNVIANYGVGFNNKDQFNQLMTDCQGRFQGTLLPCDEDLWGDFIVSQAESNFNWPHEMCCWSANAGQVNGNEAPDNEN